MPTQPSKKLEVFSNPAPERDYIINSKMPEFSCLCPMTGQPDFATLYLFYIADESCLELKSIKQYIWSFRDEGAFHEKVTNQMLDDFIRTCQPRFMRLIADFNVRGGIYTQVSVSDQKKGWANPTLVQQINLFHPR